MQITSFLRRIVFFFCLSSSTKFFDKRKDFNKNIIEHKMRILPSSTIVSEISLTQRIIQQSTYTMINVDMSVRNYFIPAGF
jgi:hypothetical protein